MIKKSEIIIAFIFFLLGLVAMYFYSSASNKERLETNKQITLSIIDNSIAAFQASEALVNNCSNAYSEVAVCFSDFGNCNLNKSAKRLNELEREKKQIQTELRKITEDIDSIIAKKKSLQN